jgi:DNA-binding SARP family transcriptional activator
VTELRVALLGSPRVEVGGTPIEVDTRKAIALLAYLALSDQPQGRDRLVGLLWPDYEPDRARASLRRTLSVLVKALGGRWVVADRRTVRLERDGVWVDVDRLRDLLREADTPGHDRRARLTEAVLLYRGDFLAGFVLRDSPEFDDWQFFTAEALRRDLADALEGLVQECAAQGQLRDALAHARRWLALDPLHEPAHQQLMTLYAWNGQRGAALRQYRECVKVLDRELGVAPLDETQELYRAIKENRLPSPPPASAAQPPEEAAAPAAPPTDEPPPLVGRDTERTALTAGYRAAGRGWLVVVEGESGIGKTRLLEELAAGARDAGGTVIATRCFEGEEHLPYGPFVGALRALVADPGATDRLGAVPPAWWAETGRILPELASRAPHEAPPHSLTGDDGPRAQARLLDAVTGVVLAGLSGDAPGLLVIDDVHWADGASLALLTYLVRRLSGASVAIALAWRSEAVPASHLLRRLGGEPACPTTRLTLERLPRPMVDRLIDARDPEIDETTRARLWEETEGVPLFIVEYLAALRAGPGVDPWTVSSGVHDLVAARLEAVEEPARQLLTTAAIIGRWFRFTTLRDASGRGDDEAVAGLEELLARGLLREEPGERGEPTYDFTHHQLRAHVLAGTSLARRRLLHRRVAAALEDQARGRRGTAALRAQIAWHLQQAGEDHAAAEQYARAGEEARAVHANDEARAHLDAALALGHPDEARLHTAIGDLDTLAGRYDEAVQRYETAAALGTPADLPALEHRLGAVHQRLGDWELAEDHFGTALSLLRADGPAGQRARILADASLTAHRRGEGERARELAKQALPLAEQGDDVAALAQVHNLLGVLATARGDAGEAIEHLERSLTVATAQQDPVARAGALNNLALAHRAAGATDRALPLAEEAVALSRQVDDRHRLAAATGNLADLLREAGRIREAEARVREAVEILARIGGDEPRPEIWKLTEW